MNRNFPARMLCIAALVVCCNGCIAYRPRMLKYEQLPEAASDATHSTLVVSGDGVLIQPRENDPWRPAHTGDRVSSGTLIMTDSDSEVVVELPGGQGQVRLAHSTTVELAKSGGAEGALFILSSGKVTGSVSGTSISVISTIGGGLSLTPNPGQTAPFEVSNVRDKRYFELMHSLGLKADWGNLAPSPVSALPQDSDLFVFRTPNPAMGQALPEPSSITLFAGGVAVLLTLAGSTKRG